MGKNVYEMGGLTELLRVVRVTKAREQDRGVSIGLSEMSSGVETSSLMEGKVISGVIEPGDIAKVRFNAPSMARVMELYREGIMVYPPESPEHAAEVAKLVEGRNTMRNREFVSRGRQG